MPAPWLVLAARAALAGGVADPLSLRAEPLVLVPPLQAVDRADTAVALMLSEFLARALDARPALRAEGIEAVGFVHDTPARIYAESCPPGEFVGCAFVLGETAGADYALAGRVERTGDGLRLELHVVDVPGAVDLLAVRAEVVVGDDEALADAVGRLVERVASGEAGAIRDIREQVPVEGEGGAEPDPALVAELAAIAPGFEALPSLPELERPRLTRADLAREGKTDAAKPWERLGMRPARYLRYRNSGLGLAEWRRRAAGRRGQVVVRLGGGLVRGPVDGAWSGALLRDPDTFEVTDAAARQSVQGGAGPAAALAVGFGLHPAVELELSGGVAAGRFSASLATGEAGAGDAPVALPPQETDARSVFGGLGLLWVPFPDLAARPVVGLRVDAWRGSAVGEHVAFGPDVPTEVLALAPPLLVRAGAVLGGEARLGARLDAWLHVPLMLAVGGRPSDEARRGDALEPPALDGPGAVGVAVLAGLQARLFGRRQTGRSLDDDLDVGEPE